MQRVIIEPLLASSAVNVDLDITAVIHFVLSAAFVLLMKDLVFEPLMKVFDERERRTAGAIERARQMDEEAIALKTEYDDRMDGVRREAAVDRERVRGKLKRLELEMMSSTRKAVGETLDEGMSKLHVEVNKIQKDLEAQRVGLAAEIASRVLGRELSPAKAGEQK